MAYEPINPLRGVDIISRPRVSDVRKPNWDVWQLVPEASLWEAVALSLDIEPRKVRFMRHGWMAGPGAGPLFEEGQDFEDRLLVAVRKVMGHPHAQAAMRFGEVNEHELRKAVIHLPEVASWTVSIGWTVPPQFAAIARAYKQSVSPAAENGSKPATGRNDNLRLAMIDGYPKCKAAIKRKPKAEEFYDWLAENDRSGNVDKDVKTGGLRWLDTSGTAHEISVEDFRKRISNLRRSGSIKD